MNRPALRFSSFYLQPLLIPVWVKKLLTLISSSLAGLVVGGGAATVVIAVLNFLAEDGPYFPAALVAFFLAAPVSGLLAALQICVLVYEWRKGTRLGWILTGFALVGGLGGGFGLHQLLISPYADTLDLLRLAIFLGCGLLAGLAVFGTHWLSGWIFSVLAPARDPGSMENP